MANNIQNNRDKNITVSDYKELMDFLIGQFDKVHETMATKADLTTKADKVDIDRVLARFAMLNNKIDDYRADQIGMQRQLGKHEKWHFQTAAKIGLNLNPK